MSAMKHKRIFYQFYCGHQPRLSHEARDWLQVNNNTLINVVVDQSISGLLGR